MSKNAAVTADGVKIQNIMRRFQLDEISAVDRPAQEGAKRVIMKRDDQADKSLSALLTSSEDGHQHGVRLEVYDGDPEIYLSYASGPEGESHNHDVIVQDGQFVLSENEGHTHTLEADMVQRMLMTMMIEGKRAPEKSGEPAEPIGANQPPKDDAMADKTAGSPAENDVVKGLNDQITAQKSQIEDLTALVNLPAEHRAHYDFLPSAEKAAFLHSTGAARDDIIAKSEERNPVVFKAADGTEFRKSDDPRLVAMAQRFDAQSADLAEKSLAVEQAEFTKRAETELALLPGETLHKVALLRQLSKIEDEETRAGAEKMLVDAAKISTLALGTRGVTVGSPTSKSSAEGAFFAKAKELGAEKGVTDAKAQEMLLDTAEGVQLYTAYQKERKQAMARLPNSN